jgi:uncharacterized protein (TIGR00369 family)
VFDLWRATFADAIGRGQRAGVVGRGIEAADAAHALVAQIEGTLSLARNSGEIEVCFDARDGFTNPMGNVQGGFLAAMLDDTMGPALVATLGDGEFAPTLELKVSFLRPAAPGRITGTGRVVHRGGSIAFLAGELRNEASEVLPTATATARVIRTSPEG